MIKPKELLWWEDKYHNLGTYSVIPILGEQCTTVKISIEKSTEVFSTFDITSTTQSPQGFLELLTEEGEHRFTTHSKLSKKRSYA